MIEVYKIEDFVISRLFGPYALSLIPYDVREEYKSEKKKLEKNLSKIQKTL